MKEQRVSRLNVKVMALVSVIHPMVRKEHVRAHAANDDLAVVALFVMNEFEMAPDPFNDVL